MIEKIVFLPAVCDGSGSAVSSFLTSSENEGKNRKNIFSCEKLLLAFVVC
jgi:hypothetical protein